MDHIRYCCDLDHTLCRSTEGEYNKATPIKDRILKINELYDAGHHITIETGRGSGTGKDWYEVTKNQLESWGVKYHVLRTGVKIPAEIYIDDKAIRPEDFFRDDQNSIKEIEPYLSKHW